MEKVNSAHCNVENKIVLTHLATVLNMFFVTFNMVDMSIKCIKNIKIVFELLLFIRINIIIIQCSNKDKGNLLLWENLLLQKD